ncbi:MAG: hypothetical protein D6720_10620 [Gammaproteobacteria bacterium]|nr:MAG: hypothetical protein D6720_10620 [Gammaproteobacteria bacterium]
MHWLTDLIGWPWYTNWYPLVIGILFFLWLFMLLFRVLESHIPRARWLLDRRIRLPLALVLACAVVLTDVIQIGRTANRLCREQGGLHVFRTVEAEGFYGSSSIEYWSKYGFKYVESGLTQNGVSHWTMEGEKVQHRYVPEPTARYQWKGKENHRPLTLRLSRSSSHVIDRQTGEELGTLVWFTIYPGWVDRFVLGHLPGEFTPWICGWDAPNGKGQYWPARKKWVYSSDDLIKGTIKPIARKESE